MQFIILSPLFRLFAAPIAAFISFDGIIGSTVPPPARNEHIIALCAADLLGGRVISPFKAEFSISTIFILFLYSTPKRDFTPSIGIGSIKLLPILFSIISFMPPEVRFYQTPYFARFVQPAGLFLF